MSIPSDVMALLDVFVGDAEAEHNIVVVFASLTGSRGRATNAVDSDYDIRGLFTFPDPAAARRAAALGVALPVSLRLKRVSPCSSSGCDIHMQLSIDHIDVLARQLRGHCSPHCEWLLRDQVCVRDRAPSLTRCDAMLAQLGLAPLWHALYGHARGNFKSAYSKTRTTEEQPEVSCKFITHTIAYAMLLRWMATRGMDACFPLPATPIDMMPSLGFAAELHDAVNGALQARSGKVDISATLPYRVPPCLREWLDAVYESTRTRHAEVLAVEDATLLAWMRKWDELSLLPLLCSGGDECAAGP